MSKKTCLTSGEFRELFSGQLVLWGLLAGIALAAALLLGCTLEVPEISADVDVDVNIDPCYLCYPTCSAEPDVVCVDDNNTLCAACRPGCLLATQPPQCGLSGVECYNTSSSAAFRVPAVCVLSENGDV
jgi:hypothetical protein